MMDFGERKIYGIFLIILSVLSILGFLFFIYIDTFHFSLRITLFFILSYSVITMALGLFFLIRKDGLHVKTIGSDKFLARLFAFQTILFCLPIIPSIISNFVDMDLFLSFITHHFYDCGLGLAIISSSIVGIISIPLYCRYYGYNKNTVFVVGALILVDIGIASLMCFIFSPFIWYIPRSGGLRFIYFYISIALFGIHKILQYITLTSIDK